MEENTEYTLLKRHMKLMAKFYSGSFLPAEMRSLLKMTIIKMPSRETACH